MTELEPTWPRVIAIWWLLAWRGIVGGILIGIIVGIVMGIAAALGGIDRASMRLITSLISAPAGLVWAGIVIRMALKKKFRGFRVALLPPDAA
jgi:hypothetical protein